MGIGKNPESNSVILTFSFELDIRKKFLIYNVIWKPSLYFDKN